MTPSASAASWEIDGNGRIALAGSWNLLADAQSRRHVLHELEKLESPRSYCWDLLQIDALDSTGALVLWRVWHGQLPERLECLDEQRHWFTRLESAPPLDQPSRNTLLRTLERLGRGLWSILSVAGGMLVLIGQLMLDVGYCVRHPRVTPWKELCANIYRIGATSMLLLGTVGFLIGVVMTIQLGDALSQFGAGSMIIGMMGTAIPRELGPVITGLLMAGRTGSAMTASIGAMHITEEFNALRAFGSAPTLRLALPRVIGATISMPLLVVWADCTAMMGGALTSQFQLGINYRLFVEQMPQQVQIVNFWLGLGKGALFGFTIALVGCYFGLTSAPDTESMSRNTTLSVVTSLTLILLIDASLGAAMTHVGLL